MDESKVILPEVTGEKTVPLSALPSLSHTPALTHLSVCITSIKAILSHNCSVSLLVVFHCGSKFPAAPKKNESCLCLFSHTSLRQAAPLKRVLHFNLFYPNILGSCLFNSSKNTRIIVLSALTFPYFMWISHESMTCFRSPPQKMMHEFCLRSLGVKHGYSALPVPGPNNTHTHTLVDTVYG